MAGHTGEFPDQLIRLLFRNKLGRLDRIPQKLQLRYLKLLTANMVIIITSDFLAHHIHTKNTKCLQIVIQALPISSHPISLKGAFDLRHSDHMLIIGLLKHNAAQIVQFEFLICSLGHNEILLMVMTRLYPFYHKRGLFIKSGEIYCTSFTRRPTP